MMSETVLLYPTLNDGSISKIRFQKQKFKFFYSDKNDDEYELVDEPVDSMGVVSAVSDPEGRWTQDDYNLCFRRKYCLRTFNCLFGEDGIACKNSVLGLAIQWKSSDSKQRGVIRIGEFSSGDSIMETEVEYHFGKAQLRGRVDFSTVMYVAKAGVPGANEGHLANENGYILGELDNYTLLLDGTSSSFPIFEVPEEGQPLWSLKCDWIDPTEDLFSECVSINLNTAHRNYPYIDRNQKVFDGQLLSEIMSSAITLIIEKVRSEPAYWDAIMHNQCSIGSIGQAVYYFSDTLGWDLSSAESVSLSARKYFDQRLSK